MAIRKSTIEKHVPVEYAGSAAVPAIMAAGKDDADDDLTLDEDDDETPSKGKPSKAPGPKKNDEDGDGDEDDVDEEDDDWEKVDEEDDWDPDFEEFDLPKSGGKGGKKNVEEDEDFKLDEDLNEFDDLFGDGGDSFDDDDDY